VPPLVIGASWAVTPASSTFPDRPNKYLHNAADDAHKEFAIDWKARPLDDVPEAPLSIDNEAKAAQALVSADRITRNLKSQLVHSAMGKGIQESRAQKMPVLQLARHQNPRAPDTDLSIDQSKLRFKWVLGSGAFGEVWFGTWQANDGQVHKVAIKVLMTTAYGGIVGKNRVRLPSSALPVMHHWPGTTDNPGLPLFNCTV
jgi:hypothetical protein